MVSGLLEALQRNLDNLASACLMVLLTIVLIALAAIIVGTLAMSIDIRSWHHGFRIICPNTGMPATVRIRALRAAITDLASGKADVRICACSLWPREFGCHQQCANSVLKTRV